MPVTTVHWDQGSGSNTAASGSNAPTTAVTGSSDASGTAATNTITFSSSDITGTNNDGTDNIWVDTVSGNRHIYRVTAWSGTYPTAVTGCTTAEAVDVTFASVNWAIGGIRQNWENDTSNTDIDDFGDGWAGEVQGSSNIVATQAINPPGVGSFADGVAVLQRASGSTAQITWSGSFRLLTPTNGGAHWRFDALDINYTGSWLAANVMYHNSGTNCTWHFKDCTLDTSSGGSSASCLSFSTQSAAIVENCDITANQNGIYINNREHIQILDCEIHDCASRGLYIDSTTSFPSITMRGCIVRGNTLDGVYVENTGRNSMTAMSFENNTVHDNGGDGFDFDDPTAMDLLAGPIVLRNNLITDNTGYGVNAVTSGAEVIICLRNNAWRGNLAETNNFADSGQGAVTLTADPYTNAAGHDYTLNNTAGGGAACRGAGAEHT